MTSPDNARFAAYSSLSGHTVFANGGSSGIGGNIVIAFAGRNAQAVAEMLNHDRQAIGPVG